MTRLRLDFAAPRYRPSLPGAAFLLVGLLAMGWTVQAYQATQAERLQLEQRLSALRQSAAEAGKRPSAAADLRQAANAAARQRLDLPWAQLTDALHQARGRDIGLLSLEADGRQGQLTLLAQARSYDAMLAFYQRLQASAGITAVSLAQHEWVESDGAQAVGFTLRLRWGQP